MTLRNAVQGALCCAVLALPVVAAQAAGNPLRNAYFGDLHLHTSQSMDAAWAGIRATPRDAYRYARGEAVEYMGTQIRRRAPLDFLAVSDHAEYLAVSSRVLAKAPPFEASNWFAELSRADRAGLMTLMRSGLRGTGEVPELNTESLRREGWAAVVAVANEFNQPGRFTTFPAFEWSETPGGAHFHRVAVFGGPRFPELPFSALDSRHPEDLWRYADALRTRGIDSVLIPHNSNLSDGLQFSLRDSYGKDIDASHARQRRRNEPLVEVTQNKGTSETHPLLSPRDEFAGFEILEHIREQPGAGPPDLRGSYVRSGLLRGLALSLQQGVNPYAFGLVGSSDYHTAASATEEDNHTGALGDTDAPYGENIRRVLSDAPNPLLRQPVSLLSASGLTGVWAEQNTRDAIFAAFKRREVFATSGTRLQLRFFGGPRLPAGLLQKPDWLRNAYASGVPMGGEWRGRSSAAPRFLMQALKDPEGANLDRIQVVKLWQDEHGPQERIYDVAWSGERRPDASTGRLPSVGSTVDATRATYANTLGAARLQAEWVDPEFDPRWPTAWYLRVIEIPTPRWTTYLAVRNGLPLPTGVPASLQERGWSSPIFYTPE